MKHRHKAIKSRSKDYAWTTCVTPALCAARALRMTEEEYRQYILEQLAWYANLKTKRPDQDEYYYIAFKLGFDNPRESVPVVQWARGLLA